MKKIAVSWLAVFKDFEVKNDRLLIRLTGPTFTFHNDHYDPKIYDKHVVFFSSANGAYVGNRRNALKHFIEEEFPGHHIELKEVNIPDKDLSDFIQLRDKVSKALLEYYEYEIDILTGPGTRMMQMLWVIAHVTLEIETNLFQLTPSWARQANTKTELISITVQKNVIRDQILSWYAETKEESSTDFYKTDQLEKIYHKAGLAAGAGLTGINFLITGETGTGKERLAQFIQQHSPRSNKPFKSINCAAFNDELLRSELFGYVKGAFTGANEDKKGLLEVVEGGILFMDEINDMTPYMQSSLLRVLESKEYRPVGSISTKKADVQIIAATNVDLIEKCRTDEFRWDLYYRLAIVEFELPSLKARGKKEITAILDFFIKDIGKRNTLKFKLSKVAKDKLQEYTYPGNFREMRNIVRGLYALNKAEIQLEDLPNRILKMNHTNALTLKEVEKTHIQNIYTMNNYNIAATARVLGLKHAHHLKKKMEGMGITIVGKKEK